MRQSRAEAELYRGLRLAGFYPKDRVLVEQILEQMDYGVNVVQLPTGYGKTSLPVVCGMNSFINTENYLRALHVLPLRSIIEDAHRKTIQAMKKIGLTHADEHTASQMMNVPGSPFLNKKLVFVTFETFRLHLMKIPPPELEKIICPSFFSQLEGWRTYGHFEIGRGAIFESFVFIDEPQLIVDRKDEKNQGYLSSIVYALAGMRTPLVVMSATVSKKLREKIREAAQNFNVSYKEFIYGENMFDKDFANVQRNKKITTGLKRGDVAEIGLDVLKEGMWDKVLVVVNTIEKAKKVYSTLRDYGALLLHGRLTRDDRVKVLEAMNGSKWVVVSTQVVEAGVNISADLLVTEAAPASSLIQRAGRVARGDDDVEGEVVVVADEAGPYDEEIVASTVETIEKALRDGGVEWRLPTSDKGIGYSQLVDRVHIHDLLPPNPYILNQILNPFSTPSQATTLLDDEMVTVFVGENVENIGDNKSFVSELSELSKHHPNAKVIKSDNNGGLVLTDETARKIISKQNVQLRILCERIVGFLVSEAEYLHDAYGV
ncbi:MAG: CRISPR-associated helicase Cas3' [Candidatus Caldarchaeum sp.]